MQGKIGRYFAWTSQVQILSAVPDWADAPSGTRRYSARPISPAVTMRGDGASYFEPATFDPLAPAFPRHA